MVKTDNKIKSLYLVNVIAILLIFVFCLWNLSDFNRIKIIDDEFGYWGIAAHLAGYDWHDLLQVTEYYSFGYSLILIPLFWLNELGVSMPVIYKIAIILNAFFVAGTYFLVQYVIKKIFTDFPEKLIQPVSLFVVLYIGYSTKTDAAWTETYLLFMFWCVIALFIRFIDKPGCMRIFWLTLATANLFTIHMRSAGVVIAVIMGVCFYCLVEFKKIDKKYILFLVISAVFFIGIFILFKNYVNTNIYQDAGNSTNDISRNADRAVSLMSPRGFIDLLLSICGKVYNAASASFLLVMIGLVSSVYYLIKKFFVDIRCRKSHWQSKDLTILFLTLTFLGELAVSSVFKGLKYYSKGTANVVQTDSIVYGRYFEFAIGPMIIFGIWALIHMEKHVWEIVVSFLAYFLCTIAVQYQYDILTFYNGIDSHGFRGTASPWIALLYQGNISSFAYYVAVISLCVFFLICLFGMMQKKEYLGMRLVLAIISICWGIYGIHYSQEFADSKIKKEKTVVTVEKIIQAADETEDIYLVVKDDPSAFVDVKILQWILGSRSIHMCTYDDLDFLDSENALLLTDSSSTRLNGMMSDKFRYLYDSGTISVFVDESNRCYDAICVKAEEMAKVTSPELNDIELQKVTTDLSYVKVNGSMYYNYMDSDGGYMTEGMGITLKDGIYEFMIDIRAKECVPGSEIGYIASGNVLGNLQNTVILYADDFIENERQTVMARVEITDEQEPFIGIYTYGNAAVRVYSISYRKICDNITLASEEMDKVFNFISEINGEQTNGEVYYIDSNNSATTGFPVYDKLSMRYLPGQVISFKEKFDGEYYIVEKTDTEVLSIMKKKLNLLYENNNYIVLEGKG